MRQFSQFFNGISRSVMATPELISTMPIATINSATTSALQTPAGYMLLWGGL